MARISVKYRPGDRVRTKTGSPDGMVTAIFIRGRNRAYEFSYIDQNGNPVSATCEEVELEPVGGRQIGFRANSED